METELFDAAGRPVPAESYGVNDVTPFDTGPLRDASGHLVQSINEIAQVQASAVQGVRAIASMFDGSKSVHVGDFRAPVGLVLLGGVLALLAFNRRDQ